jgi:arginine repressor
MELYIVKVTDEHETYEYEYGNIKHAKEHYDMELTAKLIKYNGNSNYVVLFSK